MGKNSTRSGLAVGSNDLFGWVFCSDRLPDLGELVWLHDANNEQTFIGGRGMLDSEEWAWGNSYGSIWHNGRSWDGDLECDDNYTPTHWMPLPLLPNAKAQTSPPEPE